MISDSTLHKCAHFIIKASPIFNFQLLRAYNVLLRSFGTAYLARTYFGSKMLCDPRDLVQHMVLHFGVWEPNTSNVIESKLRQGDVFLDVGANVGYDTLLASQIVGDEGKVIAVEASPSIFRKLQTNLSLNSVNNVRAVNKAAADCAGVLTLYSGPKGNIGQSTTLASRNFEVEAQVSALPIDEILSPDEISRLRLIKIDIEGGEVPVMQRFVQTAALYPEHTEIIVEVSPSEEWNLVFQSMRALGYSAFIVENSYDRRWYIKHRHELTRPTKVASLPCGQVDILFSRRE